VLPALGILAGMPLLCVGRAGGSSSFAPATLLVILLRFLCELTEDARASLALAAQHEVILKLAKVVFRGKHDPAGIQAVGAGCVL
jgi:hypothetical protein